MKLIKINHIRCDEEQASTYAWVSDAWDDTIIRDKVYNAKKGYTEFAREWSAQEREARPYQAPYDLHPDLTVKEVKAIWEEQKAEYKEWSEQREAFRHGFMHFLIREGIYPLYHQEPDFVMDIDWGHMHSVTLDYNDSDNDY